MFKLTKYGKPFAYIFVALFWGGAIAALAVGCISAWWVGVIVAAVTLPGAIFGLAFFRDPVRPADVGQLAANAMFSPADGVVTEIVEIDDARVGGKALRIGIFLSVFNVHINRVPCACRVEAIERQGVSFLDARDPNSSRLNVSADLTLQPMGSAAVKMPERVVVRQITGLIARRIVCPVNKGQEFRSGEQFGMIRFGSRTELIVPADGAYRVCCSVGQTVYAGDTMLLRYDA